LSFELVTPPTSTTSAGVVGNNYTFVGDLPTLARRLASAADEPLRLEAVEECPGGATLRQHRESGRVVALLQKTHFDDLGTSGDRAALDAYPRLEVRVDHLPTPQDDEGDNAYVVVNGLDDRIGSAVYIK
jgi:hypothetical protein